MLRVFARRQDADGYKLANRVEEFDVDEGPVDVQMFHELRWDLREEREPSVRSYWLERASRPNVTRHILAPPLDDPTGWLHVDGWDLDDVRRVYAEQRALYLAARKQAAVELVEALGRIDVEVVADWTGRTELLTPLHPQGSRLRIDRSCLAEQAGVDGDLTGRWFTVETLVFDDADGFSVCEQPNWYYPQDQVVPQVHPWRLSVRGLGFHQRETREEIYRLGRAFLGIGQSCEVWHRGETQWDVEAFLSPGRDGSV